MYNRQHIKEQEDEQCLISSKALIWILPAKGRNVAEGHYVAEVHYVHAAQGRNVAEGHYEAATTMVAHILNFCLCGMLWVSTMREDARHSALPFSQVRNRSSHNDNSHLIGCAHWRWREHSSERAPRS